MTAKPLWDNEFHTACFERAKHMVRYLNTETNVREFIDAKLAPFDNNADDELKSIATFSQDYWENVKTYAFDIIRDRISI